MVRPSLRWLLLCVWGVCIHVICSQERTHFFVNTRQNQIEAQQYCEQNHVGLSSILSEADYQKLQSLGYTTAWIGLTLGPQNWTWTDNSKTGFYNWRGLVGTCGAVTKYGIWVRRDCTTQLPFICEIGKGKYQVLSEIKTWEDAKISCVSEGHKLATFKDESAQPDQWPDSPHWMGLKYEDAGWTWVDEVEGEIRAVLTFSNWRTVNYCGLMYSAGDWGDVSCQQSYYSVCSDGQTYELNKQPLMWHEAQQKCQDKNMHLVSIHNARQNADLQNRFPYNDFWIGLYDNPWRWPDGSTAQLQYWRSGQPSSNRAGNQQCVSMDNGQWDDRSCSDNLPFFCLMKPQNDLAVQMAPSSWEEALLHCRGLGGDLASAEGRDRQMLIQQVVQAAMTTHVWVGLRFLAGQWLWLSGQGMAYQHWAARQEICPLHHCGAMNRGTGYWEPRGCEEKLDFLCELP